MFTKLTFILFMGVLIESIDGQPYRFKHQKKMKTMTPIDNILNSTSVSFKDLDSINISISIGANSSKSPIHKYNIQLLNSNIGEINSSQNNQVKSNNGGAKISRSLVNDENITANITTIPPSMTHQTISTTTSTTSSPMTTTTTTTPAPKKEVTVILFKDPKCLTELTHFSVSEHKPTRDVELSGEQAMDSERDTIVSANDKIIISLKYKTDDSDHVGKCLAVLNAQTVTCNDQQFHRSLKRYVFCCTTPPAHKCLKYHVTKYRDNYGVWMAGEAASFMIVGNCINHYDTLGDENRCRLDMKMEKYCDGVYDHRCENWK